MEKAKISDIQLFAMMFLFELGSALDVSLGISAKKDVWLAILLGMCSGVVLFFINYFYSVNIQICRLPDMSEIYLANTVGG